MKVYVTGVGIITAIGGNVTENYQALASGISGIRYVEAYGALAGVVDRSNPEIEQELGLPSGKVSRTSLLALIAAKEAWGQNKIDDQIRTGMISGTSAGGLDRMEKHYFNLVQEGDPTAFDQMLFDNGGTTEIVAKELGISGYIGTISTACSSGANAIMQGGQFIENGILDRVIAGSSDPLTHYNAKGFSSLMVYDQEPCKPFDRNRNGLNLGEGAAFVILENEKSIRHTGSQPLCQLSGWNNSTDAFHQTASSPDGRGATLAMSRAVQKAGLSIHDIDYVNAHGTGTPNNDLSESKALLNVFGSQVPRFSSTKGFTGHTLAAAGAIEAVFCITSLQRQAILPNLYFTSAIQETGLVPETSFLSPYKLEHVLTNSFGFGGNCTSLIFSKI